MAPLGLSGAKACLRGIIREGYVRDHQQPHPQPLLLPQLSLPQPPQPLPQPQNRMRIRMMIQQQLLPPKLKHDIVMSSLKYFSGTSRFPLKLSFPAIYYAGGRFWLLISSAEKEKLPRVYSRQHIGGFLLLFVDRYVHIVAQAFGKINIYDKIVTTLKNTVIFLLPFLPFL